jgi:AraC-like DNA-binding protein
MRIVKWGVDFHVAAPLSAFSRPMRVAQELATRPDYRSEGQLRTAERLCIFHYTLSGQGQVWHRNQRWNVQAEQGFLCVINDPQGGYCYPEQSLDPWKFLWFGFCGGNSRDLVSEMVSRWGPLYSLPSKTGVMQELFEYQTHAKEGYVRMSPSSGQSLVLRLLTQVAESVESTVSCNAQLSLVQKAQELLWEHADTDWTVATLAERLDVSREHLARAFQAQKGLTLRTSLLQRRLTLACRLLKNSQMSVKEIAYTAGYTDAANFGRRFLRSMKMSPLDFRRAGNEPLFE